MICLEFRFLTGRFHATPWGRHANEGAIEWPPSPWRICRALLATGFNRLGWAGPDDLPPEARSLFDKLAAVSPAYDLPPANGAHTRHYMPDDKFAAKTKEQKANNELASLGSDLTFDTFAQVGRDPDRDVLRVFWDVELDDERALLSRLLEALPYLGRAEAWVAASLSANVEPKINCRPWADDIDRASYERVEVLAPMTPADFAVWHTAQLAHLGAQLRAEARAKAEKKGKKVTPKAWAKKEAKIDAVVAESLPGSIIAALCQSPADINEEKWSEPPGTQRIAYAVPRDALEVPRGGMPTKHASSMDRAPTTAILSLTSNVLNGERLPALADAVLRTDALHKAFVAKADKLKGSGEISTCLTGMTADRTQVLRDHHRHLHILPLVLNGEVPPDRPGKARIDHILVHAQMGFDPSALTAIRAVKRAGAKDLPALFLTLAGLGDREDFQADVPALAEAEVWQSVTPFVPPRFLKPRGANSLRGQLLAEIADRELPAPASMEIELDDGWLSIDSDEGLAEFWARWRGPSQRLSMRWRSFRLERPSFQRKPCVPMGFGVRLRFGEDVSGPIALGYGAHFGLGLFQPCTGNAMPTGAQGRP